MPRGKLTLTAEVTHVTARGLWLLVDDRERFLPYKLFPWFRAAPTRSVRNVIRRSPGHLHWPDLDVDLALESIEDPAKYPLVSSQSPGLVEDSSRGPDVGASRKSSRKPTR